MKPDGAAVKIDGREVGTSPFGWSLFLDPGKHELVATKEGFEPATKTRTNAPSGTRR